ncbi:tRNA 4-thiouridine(8) synthase ThiI, partial [Staphylococcus aureus]|nr:tRNA 4-thiouridine(8) synthase ThiI [Staphylococcus aureus]HDJ6599986.1 tRNA 4-thiouridine(8) synthase ThiI [Staphylococcus aureus]
YESVFDFEEMINRAVENIETLEITSDYKTIKEQQTNQLINDFL